MGIIYFRRIINIESLRGLFQAVALLRLSRGQSQTCLYYAEAKQ